MPERADTINVPLGAYQALGWFFENSKDALLAIEGETVRRASPSWTRLTGHDPAQTPDDSIWSFVLPADLGPIRDDVAALRVGQDTEREIRLRGAEGEPIWTRASFVLGGAGWLLLIVRDITAQRRLRESESRFRGLVDATTDVVYRMSADWSEVRQIDGRGFIADADAPLSTWMMDYILPEEHPRTEAAVREALTTGEMFRVEVRVRRVDGSTGWAVSRAVPIRDDDGAIVEWFGSATDVTERRQSEEHLRLLVDELNHRVKNSLAMIEAATQQAFRRAGSLDEARESLTGRIAALAHATDLLTGDAGLERSLRRMVQRALAAHGADAARCTLSGPELELPHDAAQALTLAVHELATNALKHGSLTTERGRVEVSWAVAPASGGRRLHLVWREQGGPSVTQPERRGFGSRLVERAVSAELGGQVELRFDPSGLVCVIDAPLSA